MPKSLPTKPTDRSPFAQRLREARIRADYTQSELAMLLGVTQTAISYWENGDREPSVGTIAQFCDVLHVSPNYLIRGDEPNFPWARTARHEPCAPGEHKWQAAIGSDNWVCAICGDQK